MDYQQYVKNNYTIPSANLSSGDFVFFYTDGDYEIVTDTGYTQGTLEELFYYGSNYHNRFLQNTHTNLVSFAYCFNNMDLLFCHTNRLDYVVYGSSNATGYLYAGQGVNNPIDDLDSINNYYHSNGANPFGDFDEDALYGTYNVNLTGQNPYAVFDYTNIKYAQGESAYINIRGENLTYYQYVNELTYSSAPTNYYVSYGSPLYTAYKDGETAGYSNGYTAGWVNGQDAGYTAGFNAGATYGGGSTETATAFTYIEGAFNVAGSIMSLEVLPNITLGLIWSIPLVFVLIMTIFKLVRK